MTVDNPNIDISEPAAIPHDLHLSRLDPHPESNPSIEKGLDLSSTPSDVDWISPFTLPPLHSLRRPRQQSVQIDPPRNTRERAGSGAYYAAAWGSPYAAESPEVQRLHQKVVVSGFSSAQSPKQQLETKPLHQKSLFISNSREKVTPDSTVPKQQSSERPNWLSDSDYTASEESESEVYKTPTRKNPGPDRASSGKQLVKNLAYRKHKINESTATITPESYGLTDIPTGLSGGGGGFQNSSVVVGKMATVSEHPQSSPTSTIVHNKPLPNLPDRQQLQEQISGNPSSPKRPRLPSLSSGSSRPKKKVAWKGKTCIIALPVTDREACGLPPVLSRLEIETRMQRWRMAGYRIDGFGLGDGVGSSQSRPLFPDPVQEIVDSKVRRPQVKIPDQKTWDAWVENLQEEKLRMLGVSLSGSDVPSSSSSISAPLSRTSSKYPGLVASPPILPASAASNGPRSASNPYFHMNSRAGSVVSPLYTSFVPSLHGYKHSLAFPMQTGLTSPFEYPISQPSPFGYGVRSPAGGPIRNFSPLNPAAFAGMNTVPLVSPPIGPEQARLARPNSTINQTKQRQQEAVQAQLPQPRAKDVPNTVQTPTEPSQSPQLAHPTPRSHRQNLSMALQRGLEDAEAKSRSAQNPEKGDIEGNGKDLEDSEQQDRRDSLLEDLPILNHPDNKAVPGDKSDIETNPSIADSPMLIHGKLSTPSWSMGQAPTATATKPVHKIQPSMSKLNVKAKDFDPQAAFSSANFSFGNNNFSPASQRMVNNTEPQSNASKKGSLSKFNVDAPAFNPTGLNPGSSSFNFSAAALSVTAPEFDPSRSPGTNFRNSVSFDAGEAEVIKDSIFGKVSIAPNSRAIRRQSKALPIIRPTSKDGLMEDEIALELDDADGRTAAPTDRQKRVRRNESGDQPPVYAADAPFANPTQESAASAKSHTAESTLPKFSAENRQEVGYDHKLCPLPEQHMNSNTSDLERTEVEPAESDSRAPVKHAEKVPFLPKPVKPTSSEVRSNHPTRESSQALPKFDSFAPSRTSESHGRMSRISLSALAKSFEPTASQQALATPTSLKRSSGESLSPPSGLARSITAGQPLYQYIKAEDVSPVSASDNGQPQNGGSNSRDNHSLPTSPSKRKPTPPDSLTSESHDEHVPSYEEIDAVMKQFEDNPDLGIERNDTPVRSTSLRMAGSFRSDAPSPNPVKGLYGKQHLHRDPSFEHRYLGLGLDVRDTHQEHENADWEDALSADQELRLDHRAQFFDNRVNELIGTMLDTRLEPLEKSLHTIERSLTRIATRSNERRYQEVSTDAQESDADDEEENEGMESMSYSARSPVRRRDRKAELIKSIVAEALAAEKPARSERSADDALEIKSLIQDFRDSLHSTTQRQEPVEIRSIIEDVISLHPGFSKEAVQPDDESATMKYKMQIAGLEAMIKAANGRIDEETRLRKATDLDLAEARRELQTAYRKASEHQDSYEAAQQSLRAFIEEKKAYCNLQEELEEMELKNAALETTLEEYRVSADRFRVQIWEEKARSKDFAMTLRDVQEQLEDKSQARQLLKSKVDHLHEQIAQIVHDVTHEQTEWRNKEAELLHENERLKASVTHELKMREKAEVDLVDLEKQLNEHLRYKSSVEHSQHEISRLQSEIGSIRQEHRISEDRAFTLERELENIRKTKESELTTATSQLRAALEGALGQMDDVRADSDAQIARLQSRLDTAEIDVEDQKAKHDALMTEMVDNHNQAIREANEKRDTALEEQHTTHERKLADLRDRHTRALHNSSDDRHRLEYHLNEKLSLNEDKIKHLEGKITDLEERLDVTKSAARAAVEAAMAKGIDLPTPAPSVVASPPHRTYSGSIAYAKGSDAPEKISPQALRESIMVLQDQLLHREQKIEQLETELSTVDKEAPNKLKDKEAEIAWLRELLAVKTDDLEEIIKALSEPELDRDAIKDATIRLRANLQMEQQIRERSAEGGLANSLPSISSLASYASSPRALPLAAAAAWGNWRKARETSINALSDLATNIGNQTPSKSTIGNSVTYLSGFVTPQPQEPRDLVRSNSDGHLPVVRPLALAAAAARKGSSEARPLRAYSTQARTLSSRQEEKRPEKITMSPQQASPVSQSGSDTPHTPLTSRNGPVIDLGDDVDADASPLGGKDTRHLEDMVTS